MFLITLRIIAPYGTPEHQQGKRQRTRCSPDNGTYP